MTWLPSSPLCRTAERLNKLLWRALVGKWSKRFSSGTAISHWHSGQWNFPRLWLAAACFSKHSQQNVWRHSISFGLVYVPLQIGQVVRSLRSVKKDAIENWKIVRKRKSTKQIWLLCRVCYSEKSYDNDKSYDNGLIFSNSNPVTPRVVWHLL